jgi:AAHS family 4-hydroxybenzoate transporter-like MFS transporter
VDNQKWSVSARGVTLLCFVLNMFDGVNIFTLTYVSPVLQKLYKLSPDAFSIAFSAGLAGMAVGGLALAPLADRLGRRPVLFAALLLMGAAMIASAFAPDILLLSAARFVVGIGIGTLLASLSALSAGFAPERYRNMAVGLPQAGYPVGAMIAGFITARALPIYGWQAIFLTAGGLTLCLLPICYALLPEAPEASSNVRYSIAGAIGGTRTGTSALLWICTIGGFMALYFIASWITKLAIQAGLPHTEAIIASACYNGGAVIGTVLVSIAALRFDIRKSLAVLLVLAAGLFLVFGGVRLSVEGVLAVSFAIGVTLQGGVNAIYPVTAGAYPPEARATGLGWAMGIGRLGAVMGPIVGGWGLAQGFPLVGVFAMFCAPLLTTAIAANFVKPYQAPGRL